MISVEYKEAISETLDILRHTKKEDVDKIPPRFMEFLKENALKTYKPNLDHTLKIDEMKLKSKTKAILAIIYEEFWCNNKERIEFNKKLRDNEIVKEKELREKYNPNNIFKVKK